MVTVGMYSSDGLLMVDISVDVSTEYRSSSGRASIEYPLLYWRCIDRSLDHLRSRDRPTVGRDSIGSVSAIYR